MKKLSVGQLRGRYAEVFGETTNAKHRDWLIRRIAWRLQANAEGDLSERARRRAAELANDGDLRVVAPTGFFTELTNGAGAKMTGNANSDDRLPAPGTVITRDFKGRTIEVTVLRDGFEFEGEHYKSLSAIAKAATGAHWNGFHFFGFSKNGSGQ